MLEMTMALSDYIQNLQSACQAGDGAAVPPCIDDVVREMAKTVQEDHNYVALLLSSDLDVDRDVLRTISDTQMMVLQSVAMLQSIAPVAHDGSVRDEARSGQGGGTRSESRRRVDDNRHDRTRGADPSHRDSRPSQSCTLPRRDAVGPGAADRAPLPAPTSAAPVSLDALFADSPSATGHGSTVEDACARDEQTHVTGQNAMPVSAHESLAARTGTEGNHDVEGSGRSEQGGSVDTGLQNSVSQRGTVVEASTSHSPTSLQAVPGSVDDAHRTPGRVGAGEVSRGDENTLPPRREDETTDATVGEPRSKTATDDDDFDAFLDGHTKN